MEIYFLFALISFVLYGSFAELHDNKSLCLLQDPPNQCGPFCLTALKPLIEHIAIHQQEWNPWDAAKVNETQSKLDRIGEQQASVAENLSKLETSMEVKNAAWKKDFESRLDHFKSEQNKLESQIALILEDLSGISKKLTLLRFKLIGTRYFYIEDSIEQSWISAERSCCEMGGHLASFQNEEEFDAIQAMLGYHRWYWVGINDRDRSGQYVSLASGRRAPYLEWGLGDPDDRDHSHNCILIGKRKMWDSGCNDKNYFICQADDKF